MQSEEEGLQSKQEEAAAAAQAQAQDLRGQEPAAGPTVPVQNGEGDSLNLSAGFIQVCLHCTLYNLSLPAGILKKLVI